MADAASDLVQGLMQYARPQDVPAIRRSEYLSNALQALQATGAEQSKTAPALGANLLALALLGHKDRKSFEGMYGQLAGNRDAILGAQADSPVMQQAFGGHAPSLGSVLSGGAPPQAAPLGPSGPGPMNVAPPAMAPAGAPPPAQQAPMPQQPAPPPPPQANAGPPMMQVPDALKQQYQFYVQKYHETGQPQFAQMATQVGQEIQKLATTQVPLKLGEAYQPDGSVKALDEQWTYAPGPKPGTQIGTNKSTGEQKLFDNGAAGAPGPGMSYGPGGLTASPVTVGGHTMDQDYSPAALGEKQAQILKSDEYKTSVESMKAYQAMVANATQKGGMSGYAMLDTFARAINPGAVARAGTIQAIKEARGIPDELKGFLLNLQGQGELTPAIKQQLLRSVLPFVQANYNAAKTLNDSGAQWAQRHGVDPADVTADLGEAPKPFEMPAAGGPPAVHTLTDEELHRIAKQRGLIP